MWFFGKKKKKQKEVEEVQPVVKETPPVVEPTVEEEPSAPEPVVAEPVVEPEPVEEEPVVEAVEEEPTVDLTKMTVAELKNLAKERGLTGYSTLKKSELIDLLK